MRRRHGHTNIHRAHQGRGRSVTAPVVLVVVALVAAVLAVGPAPVVAAESGFFGDGTELEVDIVSPADGSAAPGGEVTLAGTARVGGGDTVADTSVVLVFDRSGSASDPAGVDCDGNGTLDSILNCEKAGIRDFLTAADEVGSVAEAAIIRFGANAALLDARPDQSGTQAFTEPLADHDGDGTPDLFEVLARVTATGGTNYESAINLACSTLAGSSQPNKYVVFLSDGRSTAGDPPRELLPCPTDPEVAFHTFAVGRDVDCNTLGTGSRGSLQEMADLTGGTCTDVTDPGDLRRLLDELVRPEITALHLSVNGGPPIDISADATPALPAPGPQEVAYTRQVTGLTGPVDELCVTATGRRGDEEITVTDCVEVVSNQAPVADAGDDFEIGEGGVITVDGSGSHDPDGDPLTYAWSLVEQDGPPIVLTATSTPMLAFQAPDDGAYTFELQVSDGRESDTDQVTVTVTNTAPTVEVSTEPAAEGGVALLTASFTDPGFVDTHTATVDWGDGTPAETVPVAAQGTGWGTVVASHIYTGGGGFTATVTVTDDDGGTSTGSEGEVGVTAPLAVWANHDGGTKTLWVSGSDTTIAGRSHTNGELRVTGSNKTFTGPTTYAGGTFITGSNNTLTPPAAHAPSEDPPVTLDLDDYRPGGRAAVDAGTAFHDMSAACGSRWQPSGPLVPGLYWVPCDVKVTGSQFTAGAVTIAATGEIQVSGSAQEFFEPFIDGALFVSGKTGNNVIQVSGSQSLFTGYLHALEGEIQITGTNHRFFCGIIADTIRISGSGTTVAAADCARPARTTADPSLVPALTVDVAQTPAEVYPGGNLADDITVTNSGAVLLIPGIVGIQNLDGAASTTIDAATVGIERFDVASSTWVPLDAPVTVSSRPNPTAAVTYPADGGFAGTIVAAGGYATWATQAQATLTPAQAGQLLDEDVTGGVRVVADLATAPPVPVRQLTRFSSDVAPALRAQGATVTDVAVTVITADGNAEVVTAADEPALGTLAPGGTVNLTDTSTVPTIEAPGVTETADAYAARLAALDDTALTAISFATGSGGVGLIVAPQDTATSTRRVPALLATMAAPGTAAAGDDIGWLIGLTNTSTTGADGIVVDGDIGSDPTPVDGIPAALPAGGVAAGSMTVTVPADHPGGDLDAAVTYTWADPAGNTYGPITVEATTTVGTAASLKASLADSVAVDGDGNGLPSPGDTIAYTATITNRGDNPATGVTVTVPTDPNATLVPGLVTTNMGTVTSGNNPGDTTVTVDVGTIAAHASAEIAYQAVVADPMPGGVSRVTTQGTIASTTPGGVVVTDDPGVFGTDNPTVTQLILPNPAVEVTLADTLAVDPDNNGPDAGDTLRYQAAIVSVGNTPVTDTVLDVSPEVNTTLVAGTVTTSTGTVTAGNAPGDTTVAVDLGTVAPGDELVVTFDATIANPLPAGITTVANQATVTATNLAAPVASDDPATPTPGDATVTNLGGGGSSVDLDDGPQIGDCTPTDGTAITQPTPVTCTLTPRPDTTVTDWEITLTRADDEGEHPIATGTGPEAEGTIDPTVIGNGTWIITITAVDDEGGTSTDEIGVVVEGQLKLGRYHITYQDLAVPVGGLPIRVLRTYDTLNRNIDGDFGHGWSLDVADFRVDVHRPLGAGGWEQYQCGGGFIIVEYCFRTTRAHYVTVTWPDGRVETFDFTPQGLSSFYGAGAVARYTGRPAATSELRPVSGDTNLGWTGTGDLWDDPFDPGDPYDPQRFVLVAKDGTRYTLDRTDGLVEARDRNGNTITIDDTGIHSSAGPDIDFERGTDGRITQITGPDGQSLTYTYTTAGGLETVTDPNGHETSFEYTDHALTRIVDPLGNPFQRLEYDTDGRLEAVIDANGNRTEISSDVGARTQTVTSPDGLQVTTSTFDARGNQTSSDEVFDGIHHVSTWAYSTDGRDLITSRTDPNGNTWAAAYDTDANLETFTDANGATTTLDYDDFGYPTAITDSLGRTTTYTYNTRGNLTAITDAAGGTQTFGYDTRGNPTAVTDPLGRTTHHTYTGENRLASTTDPRGAIWSYAYDTAGRLVSQQAPATALAGPAVTTYGYDAVGNLTAVTDPQGATTSYAYDDGDRLTSVTDPEGHTTTYGYDAAGNLVTTTDPTGATTTSTFDARNQLISRTGPPTAAAPGGATTHYTYDGGGRLATVTDPLARVTAYTRDLAGRTTTAAAPGRGTTTVGYDANGRVTSTTNGEGETTTYAYDAASQLTAITDGLGRTTTYAYDDLGRQTALTNPAGDTTSYTFDAAGQVTSITDPEGATTTYGYDDAGNHTTTVDPIGRVTTSAYDTRGRIVSVTNPAAETTTYLYDQADRITRMIDGEAVSTFYTYDDRGLPTQVTNGAGNTHTTTYDPAGRPSIETDGRGNPTTYTYDPAGQLTRITDALGGHVEFGYDPAGQQISVTDPNGDTRTATYTPGGDLAAATDPLGRTTTHTYDLAGRRTATTDPRGLTTSYAYDAAGQLTDETRPEGPIAYTYDPAGRRTAMADPTGTTTWTHDNTGRVTQVASPAGTLDYSYDPAGQLTAMARPDGTVTYTHDGAGRTNTIAHPALGVTDLDWRADNQLDAIARPNGVDSTYTYDGAGRLQGIEHTGPAGLIADYTNTLDANGNRTSLTITETGQPTRTENYTLDDLNRLTGVDYGDGTTETFHYDPAGNRTQRTRTGGTDPGTTTYTYDNAQQLTTSTGPDGTTNYTHDQAGNLTTATGPNRTDTYTWDSQSMLTAATIGGTSQTYEHDADGKRVAVDGSDQLWDTISGGLPTLVDDGTGSYLHGPDGILAASQAGGESWMLADPLGSIRTTTDGSGAVAGTSSYDAYGATRSTTGTNTPYGYTGEYTDPTGLVHLRARQYDPSLGRFSAADTVQPNASGSQGWSLYSYAGSNPVTRTDPSGHMAVEAATLHSKDNERTWRPVAVLGACIGGVVTGVGTNIALSAGVVALPAKAAQVTEIAEETFVKRPKSPLVMVFAGCALLTVLLDQLGDLPSPLPGEDGGRREPPDDLPPCPERGPGPDDYTASSEDEARREAFRRFNVPEDAPFERIPMYGRNDNLTGPQGQPWEIVRTIDATGEIVDIDHHKWGHLFTDQGCWEISPPHYHAGGHIYYP